MKEEKRLIFRVFHYLDILENRKNQPMIQEIRGLLYNILEIISRDEENDV